MRDDAPENQAARGLANSNNATPAARRIAVCADSADSHVQDRAARLARDLQLPLAPAIDRSHEMLLTCCETRLELRFMQAGGPSPLAVDFVEGSIGYFRRRNRFGLLYQAVGFRNGRPSVLDATAGLGRDAFRLAQHGCAVLALERSPVLHALLADGLARAEQNREVAEQLAGRLQLIRADARDYLQRLDPLEHPDVIYLDPMFPSRKKSALVKIEMRILHEIVGADADAADLFQLARSIARHRVVVKRPRLAEPLAPGRSHTLSDKTTRYDVYLSRA